jgi:XTP/dITP diphosphohydrolase
MQLLIATYNPGKLIEIQDLLKKIPVELVIPSDLHLHFRSEENGSTYEQNARIKAQALCALSNMVTLADDSGLEVEQLNGKPGLFSARFSTSPHAEDADRRRLLLIQLQGKPQPWAARFVCAVALAIPQDGIFTSRGECAGEIIPQERGTNGFGYDPVFLFPQLGKTMAELSLKEKNCISHRALAIRNILPKIQEHLL